MAKVKLNPVMEKVHGKIGDLVFRRYHDEVIMAHAPDVEGRVPTAGQAAQQERFKLAVLYGNTVIADGQKKAIYEAAAKAKDITVFALTIGDFLNAPAVDEIDLSGYTGKVGESIHIQASDDFEVTGVQVTITNASGTVLEHGPATKAAGGAAWNYVATTDLPLGQHVSIEVTATDRPGHKTTKTATK